MPEPKYIKFISDGTSTSGKTKVWRVTAKDDDSDFLGEVRWYGVWRCYGFFPFCGKIFQTVPVFEKQCLRDIADFLEDETKKQKLGV